MRTECHRRIGCWRTGALLQHKALRVSDHSQRFCACRATANSYFEVLGEKATHKKLTEVNGDAVEEEVSVSSSIVDGNVK